MDDNPSSALAEGRTLLTHAPRFRQSASEAENAARRPGVVRSAAAVLRSDIVGFTILTDRMVKRGIAGAEALAELMNRIIGRMAAIALEHGGEMTSWEGDAGTFVWFAPAGQSLDDAVLLAIQAARAIHKEASAWLVDGDPIRFRSSVGCGSLSHFEVGGEDEEWVAVLAGPALSEVTAGQRAAAAGEAVLSPSAYVCVGDRCLCAKRADGFATLVDVLAPVALPVAAEPPDVVPMRRPSPQMLVNSRRRTSLWGGEFRVVTAVYVTLRSPDYDSSEDTLSTLQEAARRMQTCLARFEGQLYLTAASDEGVTFIAVFGLPPLSHEDDATRSVLAALALHRDWAALGLTSSTGIATGRIFCGGYNTTIGHVGLALVGPAMNMAARLMQLNAGVVCDEETRQAGRTSDRIRARQLAPRAIKGKADPVTAYAAYDVAETGGPSPEEATVIGREMELGLLTSGVARAQAGTGATIVIEGDAGIGKTTLINRAAVVAREIGLIVLTGSGDSTDQTTPYLSWRRVVLDLLAMSDLKLRDGKLRVRLPNGADKRAINLAAFEDLLPLLGDILGLQIADTRETALLRGQARADALARLLQQMILETAKAAPVLLIVEDAHWLDPTSLALFASLAGATAPLLLLGSARGPETNPAVRRSLALAGRVQWLRVEPMNVEETGRVLARTLGARHVDADLATVFRQRTGGNPLFVEELSRLAFANQLLFVDGIVQSRTSAEATKNKLDEVLERQGLPGTIEGVIRRRLDALREQDLIVLRAASVVGSVFERDLCSAGAPQLTPVEIEQSMAALTDLGVVGLSDRAAGEYVFRHAVLRDVVYNAMAFAERRQLHEAIGLWIEAHSRGEDVNALLGRHFYQAQRKDRAVRYMTAAGETAVRRHANEEATELLLRAHELGGAEPADNAHLAFLLGRALQGLSRYAECRSHNEAGLRLAGFPTPSTTVGVALAVVAQTAGLVRHRLWPRRRDMPAPQKARLRETVLAFEALAETYYFSGAALRTLHAAMAMLNLSERLGPSAELARGCATLAGISGFFRFRSASNHYAARALKILAGLDDPGAETWVYTLLGLSKRAEGQWDVSAAYFARVTAAAVKTGDHRRWRDGVEGAAVNEACRGAWSAALAGLAAMLDSAAQDSDRRYLTVATREIVYCHLQLGDLAAAAGQMVLLKRELERGLGTEEAPTRLDAHAFAATLALQSGDLAQAEVEAQAALSAIVNLDGRRSVTNTYWSIFLVARVFANLWFASAPSDAGDRRLLSDMATSCRALSRQTRSFPIAGPATAVAHGYLAQLRRRTLAAQRLFRRAEARAERLGLRYEAHLARQALGLAPKGFGLSFLIAEAPTHAT